MLRRIGISWRRSTRRGKLGAVAAGPREDLGDVPPGVVVRVDRLLIVARSAGGPQVVGHAEDRVRRLPHVRRTLARGADPVAPPGGHKELGWTAGTSGVELPLDGAGGCRIAPVIALDAADPGQDRP